MAALVAMSATGTAIARAGERANIPASANAPALSAYVARPAAAGPAPGILVLHGCGGYDSAMGKIADELAAHGYTAVAIDSLAAHHVDVACDDASFHRTQADDARAALDWMRTQPGIDPQRLAVIGFSMGAIATLDIVDSRLVAAAPAGVKAAVAYYPACRNRDPASVTVPLQIFDGSAGKSVAITTYPGATHAFNIDRPDAVYHGHHMHYDATAAADADRQMLAFFAKYLAATP